MTSSKAKPATIGSTAVITTISSMAAKGMTPSSVDQGPINFRLSKGIDTIKDFSIADDDQLLISNTTNLTIEQVGRHLLLTDADKDINTTLKGVALDDLLLGLNPFQSLMAHSR